MTLEPVNSVKPVAPYIGGKRALSKTLVDQIAAVDHDLYAEPFVGMGGVFFRRKHRPRAEVINDISKDVVLLSAGCNAITSKCSTCLNGRYVRTRILIDFWLRMSRP